MPLVFKLGHCSQPLDHFWVTSPETLILTFLQSLWIYVWPALSPKERNRVKLQYEDVLLSPVPEVVADIKWEKDKDYDTTGQKESIDRYD